jgi:hypothetical protein
MASQIDLQRLSAIARECAEDIVRGFSAGEEEYGVPAEELVAMVADVSTELGRELSEHFGLKPKRFLVNIMAFEHWSAFFEDYAPHALPLKAKQPPNCLAIVFVLPAAGGSEQVVLAFAERDSWRVTAPGGVA